MFGGYNGKKDEKLYLLEPVVVLERLREKHAVRSVKRGSSGGNAFPSFEGSGRKYGKVRGRRYRRKKTTRNINTRILREGRNASESSNHLEQSDSCSSHTRSHSHHKKSPVQAPEKRSLVEQDPEKSVVEQSLEKRSILEQVSEKQSIVEQVSEKKSIEEERPHKCAQCEERFHTSILLAVHKRIHNISEDESEGNDDVDEIANVHDIIHENRTKDPSLAISSDLEKNHVTERTETCEVNKDPPSTVLHIPERDNSRQNIKIFEDQNKDLSISLSSAPEKEKEFKVPHRDHDYALSADKNPALKRKEEKNKKRKKKNGLANNSALFTCNQCPASFSRSWYLQLHLILLHYIHGKDTFIECPGCKSLWEKEDTLRQHIENSHNLDLAVMNGEISSSLRVPTDALTGENKKFAKKKVFSQGCPAKPISFGNQRTACDWKEATSFQKDEIMGLVESELRHVVSERNKLGDHLTYCDVQRLGLEIAQCLRVSDFFNGNPTKRWAQKILGSVGQIPRPGKFRFVHNVNACYLNAVSSLSKRGLSESTVFYAFEAIVCSVQQNQIVQRSCGHEVEEDSITAIFSTNANGTVLLHPTFTYRGQITDYKNIHTLELPSIKTPPKDFFESPNFRQWFAQFLISIPKTRPVLLLVEGDVSQLSYSIILMARENDVHFVFLPSRKRFVHSHQLIRKSLVSPLVESFESELEKFLRSHNAKSVHLQYFEGIFDSSWDAALQKAEISKSFLQSGFLPLPQTIHPLEEAAREYLDVVLHSKGTVSGTDSSHSEIQSDDGTSVVLVKPKTRTVWQDPSLSLPECQVKLETVQDTSVSIESGSCPLPFNVKEELGEELILPENDAAIDLMSEVKQEPVEYIPEEPPLPMPDGLENLKLECPNCNQFFHTNEDLTTHTCTEDSANNYSCPTCDAEFAEEGQLLNHNCDSCNSDLSNSDEFELHTCHICNMSFALKDTLEFHMTTHQTKRLASQGLGTVTGEVSLSNTSACRKRVFEHVSSSIDHRIPSKLPKQVSFELKDTNCSGRQISPALSSSSRTASPSSSTSSRTLTASPSDIWAHSDDDACLKKDADKGNTNLVNAPVLSNCKTSIPIPKLTPSPLPDHDYLGQQCRNGTNSAFTSSPKKPREPEVCAEKGGASAPFSSIIITSHNQSTVLSRKQTKKVFRRIQLVCAESNWPRD
ncbi:uncharacterized protein LOC117652926 [Thrips palmi]|uniref:Uncharacterized protein LOC117652926 n=1 Tax=Thrips palmi TaxID=161013 RepID=A0A6P9AE38_THRPL|nr:uncharacterized protein LOC117652926 [Thrips palmi]